MEPEALLGFKPAITVEDATPSPMSNTDDFVQMLLRKHETLKPAQPQPLTHSFQCVATEIMVNKQVQLLTEDFSALSMRMDQSTLPLEPLEYSPLKPIKLDSPVKMFEVLDQDHSQSPLKFCEQASAESLEMIETVPVVCELAEQSKVQLSTIREQSLEGVTGSPQKNPNSPYCAPSSHHSPLSELVDQSQNEVDAFSEHSAPADRGSKHSAFSEQEDTENQQSD